MNYNICNGQLINNFNSSFYMCDKCHFYLYKYYTSAYSHKILRVSLYLKNENSMIGSFIKNVETDNIESAIKHFTKLLKLKAFL